jgi:hypothetical protein
MREKPDVVVKSRSKTKSLSPDIETPSKMAKGMEVHDENSVVKCLEPK